MLKHRHLIVLTALIIAVVMSVPGCSGPGDKIDTGNTGVGTATPTTKPGNTGTPTPGSGDILDIPWPGPSMLFRMDGLSWFSYKVTSETSGKTLITTLKVTYSDAMYDGIPAKRTYVTRDNEKDGMFYHDDIFTRKSDGRPLGGYGGILILGKDSNSSFDASTAWALLRELDVSANFDVDKDKKLKATGFETIGYGGKEYNCTMYTMPGTGMNYSVWHSDSLKLPPKIVARYTMDRTTFELLGWG